MEIIVIIHVEMTRRVMTTGTIVMHRNHVDFFFLFFVVIGLARRIVLVAAPLVLGVHFDGGLLRLDEPQQGQPIRKYLVRIHAVDYFAVVDGGGGAGRCGWRQVRRG